MLVNGARDVIAQFRGHGSAQGLELFLEDLVPPKGTIRFGHVRREYTRPSSTVTMRQLAGSAPND